MSDTRDSGHHSECAGWGREGRVLKYCVLVTPPKGVLTYSVCVEIYCLDHNTDTRLETYIQTEKLHPHPRVWSTTEPFLTTLSTTNYQLAPYIQCVKLHKSNEMNICHPVANVTKIVWWQTE